MIELTALNNEIFLLNIDMIYKITQQPDTIITLSNGNTIRVRENMYEVLERFTEHKKMLYSGRLEEI